VHPQRGDRKTPARAAHEKSRAFRLGAFRAGIRGVSVLFRGRGDEARRLQARTLRALRQALMLANNLVLAIGEAARARRRAA
jgi:hypothetical protein